MCQLHLTRIRSKAIYVIPNLLLAHDNYKITLCMLFRTDKVGGNNTRQPQHVIGLQVHVGGVYNGGNTVYVTI